MTNLASNKAEQLRNDIRRMVVEAKTKDHPHLSEEDRRMGEYALQKAVEAAERMLANLEQALKIAEAMNAEEGDEPIFDPSRN